MNRERLLKMADFLEQVDEQLFDLSDLINYDRDNPNFEDFVLLKPCGTTGCAVGHMPHIFPDDWEYVLDQYDFRMKGKGAWTSCIDSEEYLDINNKVWEFLFEPCCYPASKRGPKDVATRIRWFAQQKDDFRFPVYFDRIMKQNLIPDLEGVSYEAD